jgi:hypothetical protein
MPKGLVVNELPASCERAFDLIHDYDRRLEWDTLLSEAYLEPPFVLAEKGAVSLCRGRPLLGGIGVRTVYVSFDRGRVAAVKMINRPPLLEMFAASIRHIAISENTSKVEYRFSFLARPRVLSPLLHPIMQLFFRWETQKRLRALSNYLSMVTIGNK